MVDTAYFLALTFIILRLTAYFVSCNVFFPTGTPAKYKGAVSLVISMVVLSSGVDYSHLAESITNNYYLVLFAVNEVMTGLIFGTITSMAFNAAKLAGCWMDYHCGFMMTSIMDPATNTQATLLGNLSYMASTVLFFILDGHILVLNCLMQSFHILPIGKSIVFQENLNAIFEIIINYIILGLKIAIPIVLIIIIVDLCLGLITRTVPNIPVMLLGMPIKFILGLSTYILLLPILFKAITVLISNLPNIFESLMTVLNMAPVFLIFAKDPSKTEEATPKRKSDARKKGQVPRSKEINTAATMIMCTFLIAAFSGILAESVGNLMMYFLKFPGLDNFGEIVLKSYAFNCILTVVKILLIFAIPILVTGIVANIAQTKGVVKVPLKFDIGKLKPKLGFKMTFSLKSSIDMAKNIIVVTIVTILLIKFLKSNYLNLLYTSNMTIPELGKQLKDMVVYIFKQVSLVLVIVAAADFYIQKKLFNEDMKMTKQEVKDEYKNMEGDPVVKGKQKQKRRELAMQRMMQSVADATVVVTNPTHLAIALKYAEDGSMEAPKVVGKGADYLALKIKAVAKEHEVPIIENKPLARLMYERVEIDEEIPQDLYQGVAEILAVVMKLKK